MTGRLKAATLMEVIIAMVVILIVFALAMGIYANIVRSSPTLKVQQWRSTATALMEEYVNAKNWKEETVEIDSLTYQKKVESSTAYPELQQISISVTEHGTVIGTVKRLVKNTSDENQ